MFQRSSSCLLVLLCLGAATPARAEPAPPPDPALFDEGAAAFQAQRHAQAAQRLYDYAKDAPATDERRGWAELWLAQSLAALGYEQAAARFLAKVAQERATPEVLAPALAALREIARHGHDELLIEQGLFGALDIALVPDSTSAFVLLQQGRAQLKLGRERWANAYFQQLPAGSQEALRARLLTLIARLRTRPAVTPELLGELSALSQEKGLPLSLRNEVMHALARLHFERKDYAKALASYREIQLPPLETGRAALYLEEAWTRYHLGELHAAMGLLTTLDAPSFRGELLPDKYLLRAFIYRDLCQYLPARRAARALRQRYAQTLGTVHDRKGLLGDAGLVRAAVATPQASRAYQFLKAVEREKAQLESDGAALGDPLRERLLEIYRQTWAEAARRYRAELEPAAEEQADRLLAAVEQARLMDYEIGLKLFQRARALPAEAGPGAQEQTAPDAARFEFKGEYWNDELRDYRFQMADRCQQTRGAP